MDCNIKSNNIHLDSKCQCCRQMETLEHLSWNSDKAKFIYTHFGEMFDIDGIFMTDGVLISGLGDLENLKLGYLLA